MKKLRKKREELNPKFKINKRDTSPKVKRTKIKSYFGIPSSLSKTFQARTSYSVIKKTALTSNLTNQIRRNSLPKNGPNFSPKAEKTKKGFRSPSLADPKFYTPNHKTETKKIGKKKEIKDGNIPENTSQKKIKITKFRSKSNESGSKETKIQKKLKTMKEQSKVKRNSHYFERFKSTSFRYSLSRLSILSKTEISSPGKSYLRNSVKNKRSFSKVTKKFTIVKNKDKNEEKLGERVKVERLKTDQFSNHFASSEKERKNSNGDVSYGLLESIKKKFKKIKYGKGLNKKNEKSNEYKKISHNSTGEKNKNFLGKILPKGNNIKTTDLKKKKRRKSPRDFLKDLRFNRQLYNPPQFGNIKIVNSPDRKQRKVSKNLTSTSKKEHKKSIGSNLGSISIKPFKKWKKDVLNKNEINLSSFMKKGKINNFLKISNKKNDKSLTNKNTNLVKKNNPNCLLEKKRKRIEKYKNKEVTKSSKNLKNYQTVEKIQFNLQKKASETDSIIIFGFSPFYTSKLKLTRKYLKMRKEVREIRNQVDKIDIIQLKIKNLIKMKKTESNPKEIKANLSPQGSSLNETDPLLYQNKNTNEELEKTIELNYENEKELNTDLFNSMLEEMEKELIEGKKEEGIESPGIVFSSEEGNNSTTSSSGDDEEGGFSDNKRLLSEEEERIIQDLNTPIYPMEAFNNSDEGINLNKYSPETNEIKENKFRRRGKEKEEENLKNSPVLYSRNFEIEGPMSQPLPTLPKGFPTFYAEEKNMKRYLKQLSPLDSRILEVSAEYQDELESGGLAKSNIEMKKGEGNVENLVGVIESNNNSKIRSDLNSPYVNFEEEVDTFEKRIGNIPYFKKKVKVGVFEDPKVEAINFSEDEYTHALNYYGPQKIECNDKIEKISRKYKEREDNLDTIEEVREETFSKEDSKILFEEGFIIEKSSFDISKLSSNSNLREIKGEEFTNSSGKLNQKSNGIIRGGISEKLNEKINEKIQENMKKINILEKYLNKMEQNKSDLGDSDPNRNSNSSDSKEGYFCDFRSDSFKISN